MADIEIANQKESGEQWSFDVKVTEATRTFDYKVTLSRAEYDRWSGGKAEPADVVRAAFQFLLDNEPPTAIMSSFDCSVIRRYFPQVDSDLPRRL